MAQTTEKSTKKTAFNLEQAFALWKNKSKEGKSYFTGYGLIAFYNTMKKNPNQPDLRVYKQTKDDEKLGEPVCSLWCNVSKGGKKYLSGSYEGKKIVCFINEKAEGKKPYISAYYREDAAKVEQTTLDVPEVPAANAEGDLPF